MLAELVAVSEGSLPSARHQSQSSRAWEQAGDLARALAFERQARTAVENENSRNATQAMEAVQARHEAGTAQRARMPDMDGYATAQAIRAMAGLADMPILAMTGHTTAEDMPHILESGMNARITKPLSLQRLSTELNRWIRPRAVGASAGS